MKRRFNLFLSKSLLIVISISGILMTSCNKDTVAPLKPYQFKIYSSPLLTSSIVKVVADYDNNIWVGLENNGIAKFDGSTWTLYNTSNSLLPSDVVQSISIDKNNKIWIATDDGLASFYNNTWEVFDITNSPFLDNNISVVKADSSNNIWVAFKNDNVGSANQINNKRLLKYDGSIWTVYDDSLSFGKFHIIDLEIDKLNRLWFTETWYSIGAGFSTVLFDGVNLDTISTVFTSAYFCSDIKSDYNGNIMCAVLYNPPVKSAPFFYFNRFNILDFSEYNISSRPNDSYPFYLASTKDTIWFGHSGGLSFYTNGNWSTINQINSNIPIDIINCITTDHKNNIWAGNESKLIEYH